MPGLIADANIVGHLERILQILDEPGWRELWAALDIRVFTFEQIGLTHDQPDDVVWRTCQDRQLVLVTDNRNKEGPRSLEATLRAHARADNLPVLTLGTAASVLRDRAYAERTAVRLLEMLMELVALRGTGRLYIP